MTPNQSNLRWGILGTGRMANTFAQDLASHGLQLTSVASRSQANANAFATKHYIPNAHGSYHALLEDPSVDAVYISLPNHLHKEWSIRCALAGKHILCEKPAALNETEVDEILAEVRRARVFFMEAFMYRLHPQWQKVSHLIQTGAIGPVRSLHASFSFRMNRDNDHRLYRQYGGGAIMDVGCYCVHFASAVVGAQPASLKASGVVGAENGVDEWMAAVLQYPGGIMATLHAGLFLEEPHQAVIYGDNGYISIPQPWHSLGNQDLPIHLHSYGGKPSKTLFAGDGLSLYVREALAVEQHLHLQQHPLLNWKNCRQQAHTLRLLRHQLGVIFPGEEGA